MTEYRAGDPATEYREDGASTSIGSALRDVTSDISTLVQQELALAKAELKQSATRTGQSVGMFAGAALAAYFFVLFLSIALWWAIGDAIGDETGPGLGVSAIIVAAIWLVATIVLALVARAQLAKIRGLEQTADTLGKVPNALKGQEELNR